jgi:hypothetical protein
MAMDKEGTLKSCHKRKKGKWYIDKFCWVQWCTPVISALGRLRQEDCKFKTRLVYIMRP